MPSIRHGAWSLIFVFVAGLAAAGAIGAPVRAVEPKPACTGWTDQFHPPNTIRVLRSKGPNAGGVEVVDFWTYIGVVLRAEYSNGQNKPPLWMRVGAIVVKQYAWYYAMNWRGGKTADGTCYDIKDTTADQIYKPEKPDPNNPGQWLPANVPTPANLAAMRETWHMTLRKWVVKKNKSRLFLTGYRSGKQRPCGEDSTGFKIFQKSLRDCSVKNLTLEETLREYLEPRLQIVDTRGHDVLQDNAAWRGDLGILVPSGSSTNWRLYRGAGDRFETAAVSGSFGDIGTVLGYGVGNVTAVASNGAADDKLFADLVMLVNDGGTKLLVARSKGTGYETPVAHDAPAAAERLLVEDFDGDRLADAGLLTTTARGEVELVVMRRQPSGSFAAPLKWWSGALDLSAEGTDVTAADINGDGKADLVMRAGNPVVLRVALSFPSCTSFAEWGPCTASPGNGLGEAQTWLDQTGWSAADIKMTMGDYDRDGRADGLVVARNGSGVRVFGVRSKEDGGFAQPLALWQGTVSLDNVTPVGMDVDADGLGDLAMAQRMGTSTKLFWLRSIERSTVPASMKPGVTVDAGLTWSADNLPY